MKMNEMARQIGRSVRAIFTDTIIFENAERVPELSNEIGGMRISKVNKYELMMNTTPRTNQFHVERPSKAKLQTIDEFKLEVVKAALLMELEALVKVRYATNCKKN